MSTHHTPHPSLLSCCTSLSQLLSEVSQACWDSRCCPRRGCLSQQCMVSPGMALPPVAFLDGIPANGIPAALSQGQAMRERAGSCMLRSMSSSNAAVTDALPKCCKHMESTSPSQQITLPTHSPDSQQGRGWCSVLPQGMPKILRPRSPQMGAGWVLALLPELHCCGNNHLAL